MRVDRKNEAAVEGMNIFGCAIQNEKYSLHLINITNI
jgi:hypothetical protein